jgi:hypothetical protein
MVHRRELGGQELVFGNQGDLYRNAMTWFDHDTGSVWSQPFGEAILGPRKGERLELLPSTLTSWSAWTEIHPDTLALDVPGPRSGFTLDTMQIVVEFGTEAVAYRVETLRQIGPINDVVAGLEIAVLTDPRNDQRWTVLSRRLDDSIAELALIDGQLTDIESGTVFDPVSGRSLEGPLLGQNLDLLPGITAFPWEFPRLWPHGLIWAPSPE